MVHNIYIYIHLPSAFPPPCLPSGLPGALFGLPGTPLDTFWVPFGLPWAPFGVPWVHFWALLGTFWAPLGSPGALLGSLGPLSLKSIQKHQKSDLEDPPQGPSWEPKSEKKVTWRHFVSFFSVFFSSLVCSSILGDFRLRNRCLFGGVDMAEV